MSRSLYEFPRLSRPYPPSLPAGLGDYTPCPYRAVVDKFLLVGQHLHVHVKGSIRKRHL